MKKILTLPILLAVSLSVTAPNIATADDIKSSNRTLPDSYDPDRKISDDFSDMLEFQPIPKSAKEKIINRDTDTTESSSRDGRENNTSESSESSSRSYDDELIPGYTPPAPREREVWVDAPQQEEILVYPPQFTEGQPDSDTTLPSVNTPAAGDGGTISSLAVSYNGTIAEKAVQYAKSKLGAPYVWGATGPTTFDCSGLMQWSYAQAGMTIPRTTWSQDAAGTPVSINNIKPGDLVLYSGKGHVAMYVGDGQVIHAPQPGEVVKYSSVNMMPINSIVRFAK